MVVFGGEYAEAASGDAPSGCENEDNMAQLYVGSNGNQVTGTQGSSLPTQTASWTSGDVVSLDGVEQDTSTSGGSDSNSASGSNDGSDDSQFSVSEQTGDKGAARTEDASNDREDDYDSKAETDESSGSYMN